ncbi:MAG: response regulator [Treponema sp.]|jgi:AraC-like DNA-binding protein/DNA-binding NarL/FixJ family response regulator|nr:response regulator [Treponema sp.]
MFRVLLIDDEPIILSGIKHLIDWEKKNCVIAGTASTGAEAIKLLESLKPDMVICDIGMPDISGLEVLKKANRETPEVVFIMLTNHQDFDLARESLRNRAVEYLLKNKLEPSELEKALDLGVTEWKKRNALNRLALGDPSLRTSPSNLISIAALKLVENRTEPFPQDSAAILKAAGMLSRFAAGFIFLDYSVFPDYTQLPEKEILTLFHWQEEITRRLTTSFFPKSLILSPAEPPCQRLILFMWELPKAEWDIRAGIFRERLKKTSTQITRLSLTVVFSDLAEDPVDLASWRNNLPVQGIPVSPRKETLTGHAEIIDKAKQYILDNIEQRIMLQDVANHVGISSGYLSTLFKKEFNQNLMDYINMIKTERACTLIRQGKYKIYEISYMLGFENAYYFTRVFRRHTGFSPSEYQKKSGTENKGIIF